VRFSIEPEQRIVYHQLSATGQAAHSIHASATLLPGCSSDSKRRLEDIQMGKTQDATRSERMEQKDVENGSGKGMSHLVGALLEELADEMGDDPRLEIVRADLVSASRCYEHGKKKDLALRFYLAFRSLLREHEALQERLKKAEKKVHAIETATGENSSVPEQSQENGTSVLEAASAAGA
jgi:hypothetical protein